MNRCPLTYEPCAGRYSPRGLNLLARRLEDLHPLAFTVEELRREAAARAGKMSIQGVQPKLSARLNVAQQRLEVVNRGGRYILKPPIPDYPEVPENEDLTMRLAARAGIEAPFHGLVYGADGARTYLIRRFDRLARGRKIHVEDFAQLSGRTRQTKYRSSMEQVAEIVERFCTFPAVEHVKLLRLTLFSFLVGNEDLHLKNFSLVHRGDTVVLSPAYDLLNTTIVLPNPQEELALPVRGQRSRLKRDDLVDYFGSERLGLNRATITRVLEELEGTRAHGEETLDISFLSPEMKERYMHLLHQRHERLFC